MYDVGGGATILFFRAPVAPALEGAEVTDTLVFGVDSPWRPARPVVDTDRVALAAYPELRLFIVSCRVNPRRSLPFIGEAGASGTTLAAACRSALSFFLSSFVCSPGQSAGTFIWHLL